MERMKLSDIKIRNSFAKTIPSEKKMYDCFQHWIKNHKQDRDIVINHKGYLIDGYVQYLILMELGEEFAEVVVKEKKDATTRTTCTVKNTKSYRNRSTTYIYGIHPNNTNEKTYTWRVPETWGDWTDNLQIGDTIKCITKNGRTPVIVTKIEILDKCPVDFRVKKVASREIRRDGKIVEV